MFKMIVVPVDLRLASSLGKALTIAADRTWAKNASVAYVGITSPEPGELGHNPDEYDERLQRFAATQGHGHGNAARTHTVVANDPAIDLDRTLPEAALQLDADLVVMATLCPNVTDHFWASHGGHLANHAKASAFLVRG